MKDRKILNVITLLGILGWGFLFRRKGDIKDWFLVYLFKTLVSTLLDEPIIRKKLVKYPHRYFPNFFDSNIVFLYILFPLTCVIFNQFTYRMKPIKIFFSVILFSGPMAFTESLLEKNTDLVKYSRKWNGFYSFVALSFSFLIVRLLTGMVRLIAKNRRYL
ncbi:CBO0543 family protein [Heyndrickxia acidicola]|uniref:CBO0543 family protein n=1 Tax=Heyndrickxia acidicola TaxID=209389 RepID=UPI000825C464|nr:CBO0543 family protein [Heyndrickxia acidicola]